MTHSSVHQDELNYLFITDNFFRLSVGIEDRDFIWNYLKQALDSL